MDVATTVRFYPLGTVRLCQSDSQTFPASVESRLSETPGQSRAVGAKSAPRPLRVHNSGDSLFLHRLFESWN